MLKMLDTTKLTDEEVVDQVRSSDRELYAIIMDRYSGKLLRYASNLVLDDDKATHIVQDAFIKAYINLNSFKTSKKFSSWIYRIVHNEAINYLRKTNKEVPLSSDFDPKSEEDIFLEYEKMEDKTQVEKCLRSLPVLYSEPLSLYYLENKSYQDISDILRVPIGTVATRISRSKKLLKNICQKT